MNNSNFNYDVTIPVNDDFYEMQFSDDQDNRNNNRNSNNNQTKKPKNMGFFPLIIIALGFLLAIGLFVYYLVFRNSASTVAYGNNDVAYTITLNNKVSTDSDGFPDFTGYDSTTTNFVDIVSQNKGELASYFINASDTDGYRVTIKVVYSNQRSDIVYLSGTYQTFDSNGKIVSKTYSATLDKTYYEKYVDPIIKYCSYYKNTYGKYWSLGIESESNWSWVLPMIISIIIAIFLFIMVSRMFKSVNGGGNPMSGFVNNVAKKQTGSKIRFNDVAGCDEAKAELVEMVDYFHSTDKYTRLGAKLPHGVLLVGPPGTGKTLLAKAVAGEANVPFFSISGSDFVEMYVGVGASRVRSLFKTAKQNAPCLIFIDEIDAVGRQRGAGLGGGNDEREQTLNELLVEMDGFEDNNGIIVMAATNRDDVLDPALTRPGRFDRKITVDLPDKAGRSAILKVHSRNKKLAPDISFDSIAERTVGFSGADLANIMNDAAILAVRSNRSAITTADIDEAIDRAIAGPAKRSHLDPDERKQVAYHEAGHAVVGIFLPYSDKVQKITIVPRGRTGGHVRMTPEKDRFLMTKNQLLARITGYLGGRTSEEIFFGDVSTGASNDIEVATNIARGMVTEYGMSELGPIQYEKPGGSVFLGRDYNSSQANYSAQTALEIDKQIRLIIDQCHEDCRKLLEEHAEDVKLIAETLIANETITADQIDYLLKNRKLPEVDEHKIVSTESPIKNPNEIILYPGYEWYYSAIDKLLEEKPSRIVFVVATGNGTPINDNAFKSACTKDAKDPTHIGMLFIDKNRSSSISMSIETFAEHLEAYAGVPALLIRTDEYTLHHLESRFSQSKVKTEENKQEIVLQASEEKTVDTTKEDNSEEDNKE